VHFVSINKNEGRQVKRTMKTQIFLWALLALHLAGLVLMAGTTVIDYVTFKTFWKLADEGGNRFSGLLPLMARYGTFVRAGAALLILTGIGMLILSKDSWWQQSWFKIKMGLVALLIGNGIFIGNKQGSKLRKLIVDNGPDFIHQAKQVKSTLNNFYLIQLMIFFAIILISVVKFDK
jgi:uncharacterized membrane protein